MTNDLSWPRPVEATLDNGLRVLCLPLPHLHTAHALLTVRVGSRYEDLALSGVSHLLEHVLFRGCEGYPDTFALNSAFEACSTGLDAATSRELTTFEASCRPEAVPRLLALLGDMLAAPLFTDVELEKRVIAEELSDEIDACGRDVDVDNVAKRALFPGPGLGAKVGGELKRIRHLGQADCRAWFDAHYGAENMVLVLAGALTAEVGIAAARAHLGRWRRGRARTPRPSAVRHDLPALEYVRHDGTQADVQLAWATVPEGHPDWPALVLAQRLLDDGSCARLRHRLVDQLGLAYHAGADLEVYEGVSVLILETQTGHDKVIRAVDALLEVAAELVSDPPGEHELARVRSRIAYELEAARDSPMSAAYWSALKALGLSADTLEVRAQRLAQVTPGDVRDACAEHLRGDRLQLTVVGDLPPVGRASLRRRVHRLRKDGNP